MSFHIMAFSLEIVEFFYEGITPAHRQFADMICNDEFLSKELE